MSKDNYREQLLELLGEFPQDVRLDLHLRKVENKGSVTMCKISYRVQPGERINAYLLIPDKLSIQPERIINSDRKDQEEEKIPGILAIHQHAKEYYLGKSETAGLTRNENYHYGLELCRDRGYVVLCPDLLCFEERRPSEFKRREGVSPDGSTYEKLKAMNMLLKGSSLQAKYLSDLSVSLDVLTSFSFVNGERLGVIGHSLGGQESIWLTWYDPRIRVVVSSCGASLYKVILDKQLDHNFAFYIPGLLQLGDMDRLLSEIVPVPFFVSNGSEDPWFPLKGVQKLVQEVKSAYSLGGYEERFRSEIFQGGHDFPSKVRKKAYDWLDRWLE